jgi:hypothetical protein
MQAMPHTSTIGTESWSNLQRDRCRTFVDAFTCHGMDTIKFIQRYIAQTSLALRRDIRPLSNLRMLSGKLKATVELLDLALPHDGLTWPQRRQVHSVLHDANSIRIQALYRH